MGARERVGHAVALVGNASLQRLAAAASLFVVLAGCVALMGSTTVAAQAPNTVDAKKEATPGTPASVFPSETKAKPAASFAWKRVPDAERKILAPLEAEWPKLPGAQQRKLLGAARHFPKLTPVEQERFRERLTAWSALSPEQRASARDKYQTLTSLPTSTQDELKARWQNDKQPDRAAKENAAAPAGAK